MKFFIAGIIQGSHLDQSVVPQTYRDRIKSTLLSAFPGSSIFCPVEHHPQSILYNDEQAGEVFYRNVEIAAASDMIIVYLPEASMGSSIEMWEARRHAVPIITISPMKENWVVRILSDAVCSSLEEFEVFVSENGVSRILNKQA